MISIFLSSYICVSSVLGVDLAWILYLGTHFLSFSLLSSGWLALCHIHSHCPPPHHTHTQIQNQNRNLQHRNAVLRLAVHHVWLFVTPWTIAHQAPLSMGILQERILEWVAMPFSRGSFQLRDQTQVSPIASGFFSIWATKKAQENWSE